MSGQAYHQNCHNKIAWVPCPSCAVLKAEVTRLTEALLAQREQHAAIAEQYVDKADRCRTRSEWARQREMCREIAAAIRGKAP